MRSRIPDAAAVKRGVLLSAVAAALLLQSASAVASGPILQHDPDPAFRAPSPLISGGFRFQTVDRGTRPDRFLAGVNLLLLKTRSGDQGAFWAFLSPGLHYQFRSDRPWAVSVAPVTYVGDSGLSVSLLAFPVGSGREGGVFGASVGFHFF